MIDVRDLRHSLQAKGVRLIAVSKYADDDAVERMIAGGQRDFGESRAQRLRERARRWPACRWHMIGPLQRNKAKYIGRHAAMWHSCYDLETAEAVARHVCNQPLPVLLQVNISGEPQKHGIPPDAIDEMLAGLRRIPQLRFVGLMGMAAREGDVRESFALLRHCRDRLGDPSLELSMGMSQDWPDAVAEGATMVRIGRALFD